MLDLIFPVTLRHEERGGANAMMKWKFWEKFCREDGEKQILQLEKEKRSLVRQLRRAVSELSASQEAIEREREDDGTVRAELHWKWTDETERLQRLLDSEKQKVRELEATCNCQKLLTEQLETVIARDRERVRLEMLTSVAGQEVLQDSRSQSSVDPTAGER